MNLIKDIGSNFKITNKLFDKKNKKFYNYFLKLFN